MSDEPTRCVHFRGIQNVCGAGIDPKNTPERKAAARIRALASLPSEPPGTGNAKCGTCEGEPHEGPCCSVIRSDGKRCGCTGIGHVRHVPAPPTGEETPR